MYIRYIYIGFWTHTRRRRPFAAIVSKSFSAWCAEIWEQLSPNGPKIPTAKARLTQTFRSFRSN